MAIPNISFSILILCYFVYRTVSIVVIAVVYVCVVVVVAVIVVVVVALAFINGISYLIAIKTIRSLKTFNLNSEKTQDSLSTVTADTECKQKRIIVLQNAKFTQTSDSFC